MENPFVTKGYAGAEYFCDRVAETRNLLELTTNGNNIALISPRRVGKTDLIHHLFQQPEIKGNYYTFHIDIYATNTLCDFVNVFGKAILNELKPKGKAIWESFLNALRSISGEISFDINNNPSWSIGLGDIENPETTLDEIFQYLAQSDKPCIVAIDEFQQITRYSDTSNTDDFIDRFAPEQQTRVFYVEFDRNNGSYVRHSIIPNNTLSVLGQNSFAKPAVSNNQIVISASVDFSDKKFGLARWCTSGDFIDYTPITSFPDQMIGTGPTILNDNGFVIVSPQIKGSIAFSEDVVVNGDAEHSNAVFALYHDPRFTEPFVPDDTVDIVEYQYNRESNIYLYPNPTNGEAIVYGYMYDYRSIELFDLQGRKIADLAESHDGTSLPIIDLTPYPAGTYLVRINFNRGVSVTRKVVKGE